MALETPRRVGAQKDVVQVAHSLCSKKGGLEFRPLEEKDYGGMVTVVSNAMTGDNTFEVIGSGKPDYAEILISGLSSDFGEVVVESSSSKFMTISKFFK